MNDLFNYTKTLHNGDMLMVVSLNNEAIKIGTLSGSVNDEMNVGIGCHRLFAMDLLHKHGFNDDVEAVENGNCWHLRGEVGKMEVLHKPIDASDKEVLVMLWNANRK